MSWYNNILKFADKKQYLLKQGIPEDIINWADNLSKQINNTNNYMVWIAFQAKKENVIPREDTDKIVEKLQLFEKLKKTKKIDRKDINTFKTYGELAEYLSPFAEQPVESTREVEKRLQQEGAVKVLNDGPVEVIRLDTEQAASVLCKGTEWCIKDPEFFNKYGPPYYMFYLNDIPYALLHIPSQQFKDLYDSPMSINKLLKIFPQTIQLLKEIGEYDKLEDTEFDTGVERETDLSVIRKVEEVSKKVKNVPNFVNSEQFRGMVGVDLGFYSLIPSGQAPESMNN
jgi:hypothetical protein